MAGKIELSTDSGSVALIVIGALFVFLWFAFHYPSVWIGVVGFFLIIGGIFVSSRR